MVVVTAPEDAQALAALLEQAGEQVLEIGRIVTGADAPEVRIAGLERWPG